jgi:hypothetical protein
MPLAFYTELPQFSFEANVPANLVGKEGWPVEMVSAATQKIQLLNAGIYLGTLHERLEGDVAWRVNLRGPIRKGVANGAINAPAYVKQAASGLVAANSADKAHGIAISPAVIAAGDIISYIQFDCVMP